MERAAHNANCSHLAQPRLCQPRFPPIVAISERIGQRRTASGVVRRRLAVADFHGVGNCRVAQGQEVGAQATHHTLGHLPKSGKRYGWVEGKQPRRAAGGCF